MYYIEEHLKQKRNELIKPIKDYVIHQSYDFLGTETEIRNTFEECYNLFYLMMSDVLNNPLNYGYELFDTNDYHYASDEAKRSRLAPYDPQYVLFYMLTSGSISNSILFVDVSQFRKVNKVKKIHNMFRLLSQNGFTFRELNNFKLKRSDAILEVSYPKNPLLLDVLHLVANKVFNTVDLRGFSHYDNQFLSWNYRILSEDLSTNTINDEVYYLSDRLLTNDEKTTAQYFHNRLVELGFSFQRCSWNEGPHISYYRTEKQKERKEPYQIRLFSNKGKLTTYLRVRNPEATFDYLDRLDDSVKEVFRRSDKHCKGRIDGSCKTGIEYTYEGNTVWKCGCWKGSIALYPKRSQIDHYIKLQELGEKK